MLLEHTGPLTCLQFNEIHITSGSLDKMLRVSNSFPRSTVWMLILWQIWDLRTGGIFETIQFDHAVTALQFDSRKIVAATGQNSIKVPWVHTDYCIQHLTPFFGKVYNRTSSLQSTLMTNGHTKPVERLRYMDRYLVTGGRDAMLKIWALQ